MLSPHSHSPSEFPPLKKPKSFDHIKNAFISLRTHISIHPRFWLFTTFCFLQALIVLLTRSTPLPVTHHDPLPTPQNAIVSLPAGEPQSSVADDPQCKSGRVYVYSLPPRFNKELVETSCDDLEAWRWECGILSNHGFGKPAGELAVILPENLSPAWYRTNEYSLELIFHRRMLKYKCRTLEPESATAYYIPFYAGLAVGKYLWMNDTSKRDYDGNELIKWVQEQIYYRRSNGSDHFITLGRISWDFRRLQDPEGKWGSSFLNMPAMEKITRFTMERVTSDYEDIGVPYLTGFHPHSSQQLQEWQHFVRSQNRSKLFTFIGAARGSSESDFRSFLLSYCKNESDSCRAVDCAESWARCSNGSLEILPALLGSDFCLQPKGDSFTRRAVFDCLVAGSVPVFFWKRTAYDQYEGYLPAEWESYSVFIRHDDVRNGKSIKKVLESYSREEVRRMREKVIEIIPKIVYAWPSKGLGNVKDAFDIAVERVLSRFEMLKDL